MPTFTAQLPLDIDKTNNFIYISDAYKNIKQNLKMILFTEKGQKIRIPNFGVGIRSYLFEMATGYIKVVDEEDARAFFLENYDTKLFNELTKQCDLYCPQIKILEVQSSHEENTLYFKIKYSYEDFLVDEMTLTQDI